MEITKQTVDGVVVIAPDGPVDGKTGPQLQAVVDEELKAGSKLLIDFTKVNYMSSAGLRVLLLAYRQATAQNLKIALANVSEELKSIMSVTGFLPYFTVCASVEEGVKSLS